MVVEEGLQQGGDQGTWYLGKIELGIISIELIHNHATTFAGGCSLRSLDGLFDSRVLLYSAHLRHQLHRRLRQFEVSCCIYI